MFEKVSGYPNYGVDEKGSVKNLKTGRILKTADKKGYKYVKLYNSSGCKTLFVHRIVAKTYLPNPSNWPEINHKDENPSNNCIENLEWCTSKYNANYGHHIEHCKNSLKKSDKSWLGRKHGEESKKEDVCRKNRKAKYEQAGCNH